MVDKIDNITDLIAMDDSEQQFIEEDRQEVLKPHYDITKIETGDGTRQDDFDYARDALRRTLDAAVDTVQDLKTHSEITEHPRSFEVLNQTFNSVGTLAEKLLKMHDDHGKADGPTKVENNLFVGSTKDLLEIMEKKSQQNGSNDS